MIQYTVVPEIRTTAAGTPVTTNVLYRVNTRTGHRAEITAYAGPASAVIAADALNQVALAEVSPPPGEE